METTRVTVDGSGDIGELGTWSVSENATPVAPGDPTAASGGVQFEAQAGENSDFLTGDSYTLTDENYGTVSGAITRADVGVLGVSATGDNLITRLSAVRTVPPGGVGPGSLLSDVPTPLSNQFLPANAIINPSTGLMYAVIPSGAYIFRYNEVGGYLGFFGGTGTGNGQFSNTGFTTASIDVDPVSGNVYVVDRGNNRVQWFSSVGVYLGQFSETGVSKMAVADNKVYLSSTADNNLYTRNLTGGERTLFSVNPNQSGGIDFLAVSTNYVFVLSQSTGTWTRISKAGIAEPVRYRWYTSYVPYGMRGSGNAVHLGGAITGIVNDSNVILGWRYSVFDENAGPNLAATVFERYENSVGGALNNAPIARDGSFVQFRGSLSEGPSVRFYSAGAPNYKLSRLLQNYLDSLNAGLNLDYRATEDPYIAAPGWSDSVWTKLNELCVAYNVEIGIVGETIVVRDIGTGTLETEDFTPISRSISMDGASRHVDIQYTNARAGFGVMYDAAKDGQGRTFEVNARETKIEPIQTQNFPVALQQPQRVNTLLLQPGQYYMIGADNLPVAANQFEAYGGSVSVAVSTTVPGGIDVTLIGPAIEIPGVPGPYRLAISDGQNTYPAFSIIGTGVLTDPQKVRMSTGANWSVVTNEVNSSALANPFISTRAQAWDRGRWAAVAAAGPNAQITFSVSFEDSNGFGLTAGSLFPAYDAIWRVQSVSFGVANVSVTATLHTTFGDAAPLWEGRTIGEYKAAWSGKKIKDSKIRPLAYAVD